MAALRSAIFKLSSFSRCLNPARISTASCRANPKQSLEEKLGLSPKPKKPLAPYLRFLTSIRKDLLQEQPNLKITEVFKLVSDKWKTADENLKNELKQEYAKDLLKYREEVKKYDLNLSPAQKKQLLLGKETIKLRKEKSQLKKTREQLGCPKKPGTSFFLFKKSKVSERGDSSYQEWLARVANDWHSLTENEKSSFNELHKKELALYKKKLAEWQQKMISQGKEYVLKKGM